ncbi:helix-turn-helix domain-containing protein [Brevibacterium spongiae]|uniref:Helix-turn-helix domain-containing protein n=1 Tax=Brevibacterium spongiae TaxID=2909672 RepID=A0ABY5SPN3_9MICO|nr:helix-turn-helix domain-containing protein [Brevibacterium spongiae]UVI36493.1 helix-turn-helix domain-containing protein [Brevibacterium spongiae]
MYRQTRIPRLHASLWVSAPDATDSLAEAADRFAEAADRFAEAADRFAEAADPDRGNPSAGVAAAPAPASTLIVPDGCMDLIVIDGRIVIAGADSLARTYAGSTAPTVGLRFDSGVLPQLLATSASELADRVAPLDAVLGGRLSEVRGSGSGVERRGFGVRGADQDGAASVKGAVRVLLGVAGELTERASLDPRPMALAERLDARSGTPAQTVAEAAAEFAYSPRQLRRLSAEWFGYGPKHLAKILRWQAARELIAAGHTRTAAAAEVGYSDAAHLRRDERSLIG